MRAAMARPKTRAAVLVEKMRKEQFVLVFRREPWPVSETQISTVSAPNVPRVGNDDFAVRWNFQSFRRIVDEIHDQPSQQRAVRPDCREIFR